MATVGERERPGTSRLPSVRVARWQLVAFAVLLVAYVIYTLGVLHPSDVGRMDRWVYTIHFRRDVLPTWLYDLLLKYVYFGQRGVATVVFLPYFVWTAWRLRNARPLVMLVVALILLNVSVGAVKLAVGRLGPRLTVHYFDVHMGGDIYPSGHVANTVVLYGLIAWISLRHRTLFTAIAVWLAVSVGVAAVMVNTHWFSDIVGGWLAGALVLLALPWFVPTAERWVAAGYARVRPRTDPWVERAQERWRRRREGTDATR
ncbi:PAP2 superfamily protein [Jatrophihabitans endophyticus]|uniref:PAP2 superfamily protein n=1 Tax=Jatrophihabitans endophyticus TaxID=1206085 RepID=A0A1M5DBR2_9ACTN|nr:phosphatase PAP2 family protein [Jatrophihabitans endophyticus]SHF64132.1 PAP2 superfamily protein [Jatrophihabitans endophyticus]